MKSKCCGEHVRKYSWGSLGEKLGMPPGATVFICQGCDRPCEVVEEGGDSDEAEV